MAKVTEIELERQRRIQENALKMQDFGIMSAVLDLAATRTKTPSKRRRSSTGAQSPDQALEIRRSDRVQKMPAVSYRDLEERNDHIRLVRGGGRRGGGPYRPRGTTWTCPPAARDAAYQKAEAIKVDGPSFVKPLLPSMISGGFWLHLQAEFCNRHLPADAECVLVLQDAAGDAWDTIYKPKRAGLSGGWGRFAMDHDLGDGDCAVFEVVEPVAEEKWRMKVHIVRAEWDEAAEPEAEDVEQIDDEEEDVIPDVIGVSADEDTTPTALVKEPSVDSPPQKRKREARLSSFYEAVKAKSAPKTKAKGPGKKAKGPGKKAEGPGEKASIDAEPELTKHTIMMFGQRRKSPDGADWFVVRVEGGRSDVWVEGSRISDDDSYCWLTGDEEEGELTS